VIAPVSSRNAIATLLLILAASPAFAQQRAAQGGGFSFETCFQRCLSLGGSPSSCQPGCTNRQTTLSQIPAGAKRGPGDDPRSPHYHDPEPRRSTW
jgi:hypothetical protein